MASHPRVVHPCDRQAHEQRRCGLLVRRSRFRARLEQIPGESEGRERAYDCDANRGRDDDRIVDDMASHSHSSHARIVHAGDRGTHEDAGDNQQPTADSAAIEDDESNRAPDYCRAGGGEGEKGVVPDGNGQVQGEHADEVHAPDAETHRQGSAANPDKAATFSGADALRDLDGDVGANRGDYD